MAKIIKEPWIHKKSGRIKRKRPWKVDFLDAQGKRRRKYFSYREEALDFYRIAQVKEERIKNRLGWVEALPYLEVLEKYQEDFLSLKSKSHCKKTYDRLKHIADHFLGKPLCEISSHDIEALIKKRLKEGKSNKTVNEERSDLRSLFKWAIKRGFAAENPVDDVEKLPKLPRKKRRAYTKEEIQALMVYACPCCQPAIAVLANTGIRLGELDYLTTDDFDLDRGFLFLIHKEDTPTKGRSSRAIPLNDFIVSLIKGLPEGKILKMPRSTFQKHFQRIRDRAGVSDAFPHGLRHSFTSHLVESGMDLGKIQRITGHRDITTLQKYLHSTGSDLLPYRNVVQFGVPVECRGSAVERTKWDEISLYRQNEKEQNLFKYSDVIAFLGKLKMYRNMEAPGIEPGSERFQKRLLQA